jgi:hypothetical protein
MKMKSTSFVALVALASVLSHFSLFGQASFELANLHTPIVDAPVFDATGARLSGAHYFAELWGGATSNSLAPLVLLPQGGREIVPFLTDGYFVATASSGELVVSTVAANGFAWLQLRAWDSGLGSTYEAVSSLGIGGYGGSPVFYCRGGDPYDMLGLPAPLIGLQSFSLLPIIPEPSSTALLLLGIAFLVRWRHSR